MSTSSLIHLYDQTIQVEKTDWTCCEQTNKNEETLEIWYEDVCVPQETEEVVSFYFVFQV